MWQKCYFRMWFWKCLYKLFMRKTLNSIVITVAKISLKSSIWKYVYKLFMNYKLVQLYENEKFNCDQCGKYFARGCILKVHIQIVHEKTLNWIVITVAKISPKPSIWWDIWITQNTGLKLKIIQLLMKIKNIWKINLNWSWKRKKLITK